MFKGLKFIKETDPDVLVATFVSPVLGEWLYTFTKSKLTKKQFENYYNGDLIQNAMPNLTKEEREFFLTGFTAEEQSSVFKPIKEENHDYPDW